jgi:hypothetical protein
MARRHLSLRKLVAFVAATGLIAAACNPSGANETSTTTTLAPASTTTTTSTTSTTTTTTPPSPEEEVAAAWDAYWDAWVTVRATNDIDPTPLEKVAEPDIVEAAVSLFETIGPAETELVTHPKISAIESERAFLEDCVVMFPSWAEVAGVLYQAELIRRGDLWVVADLHASIDGCVPAKTAASAIAGYEAYYDAEVEYWDPPNPSHDLLDKVMAETHLSFIIGQLEVYEARGAALRGRPTLHPEVTQVISPTRLVISSCNERNPAYGLYDLATGDRLPDVPPVVEGERTLQSAVMVLEDGSWKVANLQRQATPTQCEFPPTERGLPSI